LLDPLFSPENMKPARVRVGVDTGGTFTDFVYHVDGERRVFKLPSTPVDPSIAITEGLNVIATKTARALDEIEVVHGTTVGTNALLERRGARTALVTTAGFEDVLVIGRQARGSLYDLNWTRPDPLVADGLRLGINERIGADGEVVEELHDDDIEALIARLKRSKPDAIAVSLLFSFVHPEHERRIEAAIRNNLTGVAVSISHRILPEYREYERTSTVTINAYLQPLMGAYLARLRDRVSQSLRVMQSSGGSISAGVAAEEPVRTILSGPAGGVVGAIHAGRRSGFADVITFDMGGTSTDVALCAGARLRLTNEAIVAGLPVAVPVLDIHTVGAGGGSIARVDEGGSLRVGPESAGASPGPASYGRGTLPTVTDANLVLGRFGGSDLLGGDFHLDAGRANDALEKLAEKISAASGTRVKAVDAALGVVRVVNTNMERALRAVSVERGHDPRTFAILSFGGAGGLHAVELARRLRIPRVIVPMHPGALSAEGALRADVIKTSSRTIMREVSNDREAYASLEPSFVEMERAARAALRSEGFDDEKQRHERTVAARYRGQSFEIEIGWRDGKRVVERFYRAHRLRYGFAQTASKIEVVSARLNSAGLVERLREAKVRGSGGKRTVTPHAKAAVHFDEGREMVAIYRRDELPTRARLKTPCVVTEYSSTTLVPAGAHGAIDRAGNLLIEPW
jgi:N-methylhydantoinase A